MCSLLVKISLSLSKLPMTWKCLVPHSLVTRQAPCCSCPSFICVQNPLRGEKEFHFTREKYSVKNILMLTF